MRDRMRELWDDVVPADAPCPQADPAAVKRRVNAALNAVPSERRTYMRQKIRLAAAAAAVVGLLAGTALAAAGQWNVLDFFYEGDTSPAVNYVNNQVYSVSDDNYTLSVTSSVADTRSAYLLVTVEAKTDEARATLMADDFENMDTFSVRILEDETAEPEPTPTGDKPAPEILALSYGMGEEKNLRTDSSRTWSMELQPMSADTYAVDLRLNAMADDVYVEIPVEPVAPITVEINAEGTSFGTFYYIEGGAPVSLESVTLSPLSLRMEYSFPAEYVDAFPLLFFRQTDGTLLTWGQMVGESMTGSRRRVTDSGQQTIHRNYDDTLRTILDFSQVDAVVFNGVAYPLDGGRPEKVEGDPALYPFQLPLMESLGDGGGHGVPVRALCEGLGVECIWDNEAQTATMTYRGVTIVLTPGSTTALVNGQPVEMYDAPAVQDGKLAAECQVFTDAWQLDMSAAYEDGNAEDAQRVAWLVIP